MVKAVNPTQHGNNYVYNTANLTENGHPFSVDSFTFSWGLSSISTITNGDINMDGIINVTDIVNLIQHILGLSDLNEYQLQAADYNNDGIVNVTDLVNLIYHILIP